jgi:diguanylate cyclase (GGDEF)-like protein
MSHRALPVRLLIAFLLAALLAGPAPAQDGRPPPPPPRGGRHPPPPPPPPPGAPRPAPPMPIAPTAAPAPAAQTSSAAASPASVPAPAAASPTAALDAELAAARARGVPADIGAALIALAAEHRRLGRPDRALALLEEAAEVADRHRDDDLGREAALAAAAIHRESGDPALEQSWRERADAYRERTAGRLGAVPPSVAQTPSAADIPATVAAPPTDAPPPGSNPARWLWLLLPVSLLMGWAWLRSQRHAEALRDEAERLARHKRQLSTANTALQQQASKLREQAVQDALTGAMTRPAFARQLEEVLLHASHYGKPVALMVFDLDHFKQINDTHGHLSGDAALKLVAGIVRESLASDDLFGRFGGDEFLIACTDHDRAAALALAEHIRTAVTTRAPAENPAFAALSLSIGVAIADGGAGYRSELLFHRADAALYAAKRAGRNRSVLEDNETPEPPRDIHAPRTLA